MLISLLAGEEHHGRAGAGLVPGPDRADVGGGRAVPRGGALRRAAQHRVQGRQGPQVQHR